MIELNAQIVHSLFRNQKFLQEFAERCISLGISSVPSHDSPMDIRFLRCSLIPRGFRKILFEKVCKLNYLFNHIINLISLDLDYLRDQLRGMSAESDNSYLCLRSCKDG